MEADSSAFTHSSEWESIVKVTTLINLGAATRVVYTYNHKPVVIEIGERAEYVELDERTYAMIERGQAQDTLIMVDYNLEIPEKMTKVLALLRRLDDGDTSELLKSYGDIFGREESAKRPARHVMRAGLMKILRNYCQFLLNKERANRVQENLDENVTAESVARPTKSTPAPTVTTPPKKRNHRRR